MVEEKYNNNGSMTDAWHREIHDQGMHARDVAFGPLADQTIADHDVWLSRLTLASCHDCGEEIIKPEGCGTGYAERSNGERICYACADDEQKRDLLTAESFFAYLNLTDMVVTTWTGGVLGRLPWQPRIGEGYTPTGGHYVRFYVDVVDIHGGRWFGRGIGHGGYVRLKRKKRGGPFCSADSCSHIKRTTSDASMGSDA